MTTQTRQGLKMTSQKDKYYVLNIPTKKKARNKNYNSHKTLTKNYNSHKTWTKKVNSTQDMD